MLAGLQGSDDVAGSRGRGDADVRRGDQPAEPSAGANGDAWKAELAKVERQIAQIVDAIADGMYHPSMKEKMSGLEARKAELEPALPTPARASGPHTAVSASLRATRSRPY